jgi:predicted adenine nucleotide alpha hydrolase (AANH) superfamily ATPase
MNLLLHTCCGPCASATIPLWIGRGVEVTGIFFNPNIHPLLEWRRRLTAAQDVAARTGVEMLQDPEYDPAAWFAAIVRAGGRNEAETEADTHPARCRRCIGLRLDRAAREAAARGCEAFSTTLSISPYQDHDAVRETGQEAAALHDVEFLYEDLRPLYGESCRLSREWGVYRQKYCGCLISEWERYRESPTRGR